MGLELTICFHMMKLRIDFMEFNVMAECVSSERKLAMDRNSKDDLLKELKENKGLLNIKALGEYRRNGVVVKIEKVNTDFYYDKNLILTDGTSVVAWI